MIGSSAPVVTHSDPIWGILMALTIFGGICVLAAVVGVFWWVMTREDKDRPVMPWSPRMRVEKVRASREIAEEHLKIDALEVKRIALDHHRDRVVDAIRSGEHDEVERLALPSGHNVEDGVWHR